MIESRLLHIKNMVCPRCIEAVKGILNQLNLEYTSVELGEITLTKDILEEQSIELEGRLISLGFELLPNGKSQIISKIKTLLVNQIHNKQEPIKENYSLFLALHLNHDYSYLSRLFSAVEGITIEKYIAKLRVQKVKELLFYNAYSISEIAFQLDYSSSAYLSTQFKKETGMTPTEFKKMHKPGHTNLDSI